MFKSYDDHIEIRDVHISIWEILHVRLTDTVLCRASTWHGNPAISFHHIPTE